MERLSVFAALAVTLVLSLTLGTFAHAPKAGGHITFVSIPNDDSRAEF